MRRTVPLVAVIVFALLASGCGFSGLAFRQDNRLSFVSPRDRSEVTLPVTVRWEVSDFDVGPGAGSFAVFVNRAPQPPNRTLDWLARDDTSCRPADGCPDERWLNQRGVYPTTDFELTIEHLPSQADGRREFHEVTVVLLDADGRRVGETGWTLELQVKR